MQCKQGTDVQVQIGKVDQGFIRDRECTKETPVIFGVPDSPIYGTGKRIRPGVPGREDSEHMKKILLPELLPLEDYAFEFLNQSLSPPKTFWELLMLLRTRSCLFYPFIFLAFSCF